MKQSMSNNQPSRRGGLTKLARLESVTSVTQAPPILTTKAKKNALTQASKQCPSTSTLTMQSASKISHDKSAMSTTTGNTSTFNQTSSAKETVSLEQIAALELKIASLNDQIAQIMQRSVETQENIVEGHAQEALQESRFVELDETLGWRLSFIEMPQEASRLFTPRNKQLGIMSSKTVSAEAYSAAKSAVTRQEDEEAGCSVYRDHQKCQHLENTGDLLKACLNNEEPSKRELRLMPRLSHDEAQGVGESSLSEEADESRSSGPTQHAIRSFEDDNVYMDEQQRSVAEGFLPAALSQIKNVVSAFVQKIGLADCRRRQVEEELSRSISHVLVEASEQSLSVTGSRILDISSISASMYEHCQKAQPADHREDVSVLTSSRMESFERALTKTLHQSFQQHCVGKQSKESPNTSTLQILAALETPPPKQKPQTVLCGQKRAPVQSLTDVTNVVKKESNAHHEKGYLSFVSEDEQGKGNGPAQQGCRWKQKSQRKEAARKVRVVKNNEI